MNRTMVLMTGLVSMFIAFSCSNGDGSPLAPVSDPGMTGSSVNCNCPTQTHLWGYYDVYVDIENQAVEAVVNRNASFTANVVKFLNNDPSGLSIQINDMPTGTDYIDVDIDVSITHPFNGMPEYHGYDVRGVFMGDGSASMVNNSAIIYPVFGDDQFMFADPIGGNGAPDGYTRWFNFPEFSGSGMPLFLYTQGNLATPDFAGTATLNPYKYFTDSLGPNEGLWDWLNNHTGQFGVFSSGATNTRNYYLRFPSDDGVQFGYAVIASWEGTETEYHPSNAIESVACNVVDNSDLYYVDETTNGGNLILDISLFGWEYQPTILSIESKVFNGVAHYDASTIATGGGDNYSTYHVEIVASNIEGVTGNEFWIIAQYDGFDYTNNFGVPNDAGSEPLAAYFRYDLEVSGDEPFDPRLYLYDGTVDDGGMEMIAGGSIGWTYLPSDQVWDENGDVTSYPEEHCSVLATPEIDIPASPAVSAVHLRIEHWGKIYRFWDGCVLGYTTDNGATYTWHGPTDPNTDVIYTYYSGIDFITDDHRICALSLSFTDCYGPNIGYQYWDTPEMAWSSGFEDTGGWGSPSAPIESDWTCNGLLGVNNVRFVFLFVSCVGPDPPYVYPGFCLRELEVYVEP